MTVPAPRRQAPPLDASALERLALRYVERFATSRAKLADYLRRKIRERGWDGAPADVDALSERMAVLGYIDDRAFAEARARSLARRFDEALKPAGITSGQFSLLVSLNRPYPPRLGEVAELLAMDRTTLTANLKPLQREALAAAMREACGRTATLAA